MYIAITFFIILTSLLLILIVLVQNSKGGGLASNFAASNQIMGVRKTADFLEKTTWGLAVALLVLCLMSSFAVPKATNEIQQSFIKEQVNSAVDQIPTIPQPTNNPTSNPTQQNNQNQK